MRIDAAALREGRLVEAIVALDRRELERKRQRLAAVRHLFMYDWSGDTFDAFSAMMHDVCQALPVRAAGLGTAARRDGRAASMERHAVPHAERRKSERE